MTTAKDLALAHHMAVRDFCKALDRGQAYATGAPAAAPSIRAGGSAPLALLLSSLGPKYGLTPVPQDMLALGFQARGLVEKAAITSHALSASHFGNIVPISLQAQIPAVNVAVQKLINDITAFIAQVQNDPSNQQLLQSGLHFIADIANVYVTASSADQAQLDALKQRLFSLGLQVGGQAVVHYGESLLGGDSGSPPSDGGGSTPSDGSDPGY